MHVGKANYTTENGLAQGSALSPTLWSIYIDPLARELEAMAGQGEGIIPILFADDVSIIIDKEDLDMAQEHWTSAKDGPWTTGHNGMSTNVGYWRRRTECKNPEAGRESHPLNNRRRSLESPSRGRASMTHSTQRQQFRRPEEYWHN